MYLSGWMNSQGCKKYLQKPKIKQKLDLAFHHFGFGIWIYTVLCGDPQTKKLTQNSGAIGRSRCKIFFGRVHLQPWQ